MNIRMLIKKLGLICFGLLLGVLCFLFIGETYYRFINKDNFYTPTCRMIEDDEIGFVNPPNQQCNHSGPEFNYAFSFNSDGHPDDESRLDDNVCTIMALGDSHTRALGVSNQDAWPNVVESLLGERDGKDWQVINMGVVGFSIGQELQLMNRYLDKYKPTQVILAFSMASDAYDLRTPAQGRAILGRNGEPLARNYYDIENGELTLRQIVGSQIKNAAENPEEAGIIGAKRVGLFSAMRQFLDKRSRLYTALKRGFVGQLAVLTLQQFGISVWDNMDTILAKDLGPEDTFSWLLAEKILAEFESRLNERNIEFTVVVLPYLPQAYDHIWDRTFASNDKYDRFVGNKRLLSICQQYKIDCLDLTQSFIDEARASDTMLHFPMDAHPNVEGHRLIGQKTAEHLIPLLNKQCSAR